MRGPIEYEALYYKAYKKWDLKWSRITTKHRKKKIFLKASYLDYKIEVATRRIRNRMYGTWDRSHTGQKKNDYLAELYALAITARDRYENRPIGYFVHREFRSLKRRHLSLSRKTKYKKKYAYKTEALAWSLEKTIDNLALYCVLSDFLNNKEETDSKSALQETPENNLKPETIHTPKTKRQQKSRLTSSRDKIREKGKLLSTVQVATLVGKSRTTIATWAKEGDMPSIMENGKYFFDMDKVNEWIDKKTRV